MARGWRRESRRHSLASRGVRTTEFKIWSEQFDLMDHPYQYNDFRDVFRAFWFANLERDYRGFNFEWAFEQAREIIGRRLDQFGFYGKEGMLRHWSRAFSRYTTLELLDLLSNPVFYRDMKGEGFSDMEILEVVAEKRAKRNYNDFKDYPEYKSLFKTHQLLLDPPSDHVGKVLLMDRVVDAVHISGSVWDLDVPGIRKEFEKEYASFIK